MVRLKISPDEAIRQLNERIDAIQEVERNQYGFDYYDFIRWCSKTWQVIDGIYGTGDPHPEEIRTIGLQNCLCNSHMEAQILADAYHSKLLDYIKEIYGPVKTPEH
jgi:hypothetical protein